MSDFKSIIKNKYANEVQPQFTEDAWNKFAASAGIPKDSDKKVAWWIWGSLIFLITLASIIYFNFNDESKNSIASYEEPIEVKRQQMPEEKISINYDDLSKKDVQEDIQSENANNNNITTKRASIDKGVESLGYSNTERKNSKESNLKIDEDDSRGKGIKKIVNAGDLNSASEHLETFDAIMIRPISSLSSFVVFDNDEIGLEEKLVIPYKSYNRGINTELLLGTGMIDHRAINSQEQYNMQLSFDYKLNDRLSVISFVGYQKNKFSTRVLYQNLGLMSSSYQPRSASMDKVTSNSSVVELGFGLGYKLLEVGRFQLLAESSFTYGIIMNGNLSFDFRLGEVTTQVNDDVEESSLYTYGVRLGTGIKYQLNNDIELVSKVLIQHPLLNEDIQYPNQYRFMVGISKRW